MKGIAPALALIAILCAPLIGQDAIPPGLEGCIVLDGGSAQPYRDDGATAKIYASEILGWKNIVYWIDQADSVKWQLPPHGAGAWRIIIESAVPGYAAGSRIAIRSGSASVEWSPERTDGWEDLKGFLIERQLALLGTEKELTVSVSSFNGTGVMNLQAIILMPETADRAKVLAARRTIISRRASAWAECQRGTELRASGKVDGAAAAYRAASVIDPEYVTAWTGLARLLAESKDAVGAFSARERAALLEPWNAESAQEAVLAASAASDTKAAIRWCRETERRHTARGEKAPTWILWDGGIWSYMTLDPPDLAAAADFMGRLAGDGYPEDELSDAALYHYSSILRLNGDERGSRDARELFLEKGKNPYFRALAAMETANDGLNGLPEAEAIALFTRAISIISESIRSCEAQTERKTGELAACYLWRGEMEIILGDRLNACKDIETAWKLEPSNAQYLDRYAFVLHRQAISIWAEGKPAEARELFLREAGLYPEGRADTRDRARFLAELIGSSLGAPRKKPEYAHRVLAFIIPVTDIRNAPSAEDIPYSFSGENASLFRKDLELDARFCSLVWEAVSKGAFSVSFEFRELPEAVARSVKDLSGATGSFGYDLVTDDLLPDLAAAIRPELSRYDTIAYFWRAGPVSVYATGGASYHAGAGTGEILRGYIKCPVDYTRHEGASVLFHELWHVFENLVALGPTHAWKGENSDATRKAWPAWTGETEWRWYRFAITSILPASLEEKTAASAPKGWKSMSFLLRDGMR